MGSDIPFAEDYETMIAGSMPIARIDTPRQRKLFLEGEVFLTACPALFGNQIKEPVAKFCGTCPDLDLLGQPAVSAQQISECRPRDRVRMPILDHMRVMRAGLGGRPQEPQPVVTAWVLGPQQPARPASTGTAA